MTSIEVALRSSVRKLFILTLVPVAIGYSSSFAQNAPQEPIMISVNRVQLKPTTTGQFRALHLVQSMPDQQARGVPWRLTTQDVFGDSFKFTISTPIENYAELDTNTFTPSDLGEALFGASVESRERVILQTRPDMGIPGNQGISSLRRMAYMKVHQARIADFEEFWVDTVLPAMRNRGFEGYQIFQTLMGGSQGEYIGGLWIQNFAELDTLNMNTLLTPAQQEEFGTLVEDYRITVQAVDEELTYGF
jgi:hypothetical protein